MQADLVLRPPENKSMVARGCIRVKNLYNYYIFSKREPTTTVCESAYERGLYWKMEREKNHWIKKSEFSM